MIEQTLTKALSLFIAQGHLVLDEYLKYMVVILGIKICYEFIFFIATVWLFRLSGQMSAAVHQEIINQQEAIEIYEQTMEEEYKKKKDVVNKAWSEAYDKQKDSKRRFNDAKLAKGMINTLRWGVLCIMLLVSIKSSIPELELITKISVAPRVFLLQEGAEFVKSLKGSK